MDYRFKPVNLDGFVKGAFDCDIGDNTEIQFGRWSVRVSFLDLIGFLLRANSCYDAMAVFEKDVQDMGCDETASTCCFSMVRF